MRRGRLEALLKILAVDDAVDRRTGGWVATGKPWYFDEAKWAALRKVRAGRGRPDAGVRARRGLPDAVPAAGAGRPGPAAVRALLGLHRRAARARAPGRPSETVDAARQFFRGQDVVVEPRKLWVERLPGPQGQDRFLAPGRALAFADDPAWGGELAGLWRQDGPAPPVILDGHGRGAEALVDDLAAADGGGRDAVPALPDVGRLRGGAPRAGSAGCRWSTRSRSPARRPMRTAPQPSGPPICSIAPALRPGVRFDGPVLFVDDTIRTRWTLTVAGSLLAEAGATLVLPLAIHQLP